VAHVLFGFEDQPIEIEFSSCQTFLRRGSGRLDFPSIVTVFVIVTMTLQETKFVLFSTTFDDF
jgi:hypothetical protein